MQKLYREKMKDGELVQLDAETLKIRSSAYSMFHLICDKEEIYTGFVSCTCCKKILKHDLHVSGTMHLNRHAGIRSKASTSQQTPTKSQAKITDFITSKKY